MPPQLQSQYDQCYYTPYPVYSSTDCSQIPSPSTSGSQYSSSPSPQDYHPHYNYTVPIQQPYENYQYIQIQPPPPPPVYSYTYPTPPPTTYNPPPPSTNYADPPPAYSSRGSRGRMIKSAPASSKPIQIAHPYARLFAKKDQVKRRKIWNHALEKSIFTPYELSTLGAPQRRTMYIASLEAHIDRLHTRLLELGFWPVNFSELEPFKGLNSKTAKSMVSGLQYDSSTSKLKLLELERANGDLGRILSDFPPERH